MASIVAYHCPLTPKASLVKLVTLYKMTDVQFKLTKSPEDTLRCLLHYENDCLDSNIDL